MSEKKHVKKEKLPHLSVKLIEHPLFKNEPPKKRTPIIRHDPHLHRKKKNFDTAN